MFRGSRNESRLLNTVLKKSGVVLAVLLLGTILLSGCGPRTNTVDQKDGQSNDITGSPEEASGSDTVPAGQTADNNGGSDNTVQQSGTAGGDSGGTQLVSAGSSNGTDGKPADPVINNGGLYVKYQGNVYYRQYNADSFEPTGLWGEYNPVEGSSKSMMRLKEDGTAEVAFKDAGSGNIYISNNHMFLQKITGNYPTIYSVDLDGSNPKEFGTGYIAGIDEATGTLVCMSGKNGEYRLATIDSSTGKVKPIELSIPCSSVLAVREGYIYYSGVIDFEESEFGRMKLCRVSVDGTSEKLLAENNTNLYEYESFGTEVPCLQFVGDTIYFSYGGYAGSGYYYQGGQIARVNTDGSGFEILAGTDLENTFDGLVDAIFYVTNENGKNILYYSFGQDPYAIDLSTNEVSAVDFPVFAEGKPFEYEEGVSIYQNASPVMTTLLPKIDYSSLGFTADADYNYGINDIEQCDGWVYYRLQANEYEPDASIGWRDGYRRIKTQVIREQPDGEVKEILFEY